MEENELIFKCRQGHGEFFGELYDLYVKKIYDFLYYRVHHKQTAEDLTTAVFIKALEKIKQFDPSKAKFSTWLYQIAKNTLIDHFRTFKSTSPLEDIWDLGSGANIERDADTALSMEKLRQSLTKLPSAQREIIVMRLWDGLPHKEIAEVLNISEGNSKVAFARALSTLRTMTILAILMIIVGLKSLTLNL